MSNSIGPDNINEKWLFANVLFGNRDTTEELKLVDLNNLSSTQKAILKGIEILKVVGLFNRSLVRNAIGLSLKNVDATAKRLLQNSIDLKTKEKIAQVFQRLYYHQSTKASSKVDLSKPNFSATAKTYLVLKASNRLKELDIAVLSSNEREQYIQQYSEGWQCFGFNDAGDLAFYRINSENKWTEFPINYLCDPQLKGSYLALEIYKLGENPLKKGNFEIIANVYVHLDSKKTIKDSAPKQNSQSAKLIGFNPKKLIRLSGH